MRKLQKDKIVQFRKEILNFYAREKRSFPWRRNLNAYRVLVSEIMLQQTQVERVVKMFPLFLKSFPDFKMLAHAPLPRVLKVWQGMGYNRRAIALKKIAEKVMNEYHGILPRNPEILKTFPGIGKATAGSICAFAFNAPVVFIETNIRRVFIHFFFPSKRVVSDENILPLIEQTLPKHNTREWYSALMDYGAMLSKKIENPNRRSKEYRKQPAFTGSQREMRGKILIYILQKKSVSLKEFSELFSSSRYSVLDIINQLIKEGFIKKDGVRVRVI